MAKRDLRKMKANRLNKEDIHKAAKKANINANMNNVKDQDIKSVEDTIAKYENKSEDEMMSDLERMIVQGKRDGTFSDEMMDAFIKNVAPMMDNEQKAKLKNISRMLKNKSY